MFVTLKFRSQTSLSHSVEQGFFVYSNSVPNTLFPSCDLWGVRSSVKDKSNFTLQKEEHLHRYERSTKYQNIKGVFFSVYELIARELFVFLLTYQLQSTLSAAVTQPEQTNEPRGPEPVIVLLSSQYQLHKQVHPRKQMCKFIF